MHRSRAVPSFVVLGLVAGLLVVGPPARAATITVTSTDGGTGGPDCKLRDAITAANTDTATGGCPAGSGADTIVLQAGATYTLTVVDNATEGANGLPAVTTDITVAGNGATIERSAAAATPDFRLLYVGGAGTLSLRELTLRNGRATASLAGEFAGGIFVRGATVDADQVVLAGNFAKEGGGAIVQSAGSSVTIRRSTFSGNSAGKQAGAVNNQDGSFVAENTTFSGNVAPTIGSAILTVSFDAGHGARTELDHVTVTGGDGAHALRTAQHADTTETKLHATIVAGNAGSQCSTTGGGTVDTSPGYNLLGDSTCNAGGSATNVVASDPVLGPLASNGGPTQTHALLAGSPAFNAGDPVDCAATDQRGVSRPGGSRCDIGAYEATVRTLNVTVSGGGTVASSPNVISCEASGSPCSAEVPEGSSIVLTPTAATGWTFSGWSGCTSTSGDDCTVSMTTDRSVTVTFVDSTPPVLVGSRSPAANSAGWNSGDVTVTFTCTDGGSGVDVAPVSPQVVSEEGTDLERTATCTDAAGNTATQTVDGINIDKTTPELTLTGRTPANAAGWNSGDVTLSWACSDALSGVDVAPVSPQVVSEEGADLERTATCTDTAGNTATHTVDGINIDKTAPGLALTGRTPANAAGWNSGDVTLSWACSDGLSGVDVAPVSPQVVSEEGTDLERTATCTDVAGNTATHTVDGINIDKTAPGMTLTGRTPANAAGWNNGDVTVTWACSDGLSGVVSRSVARTVSSEGADQKAIGTCEDVAGNVSVRAVVDIDVDRTAPEMTFTGTDPAPNEAGWHRTDVTLSWSCSDALSGAVAGEVSETVTGEGEAIEGTAACEDLAGNVSSDDREVRIDRTPAGTLIDPPPPVLVQGSDELTGSASDALSGADTTVVVFTDALGATVEFTAECVSGCGTAEARWRVAPTALPPGQYVVTARTSDVASNPGDDSPPVVVLVI